MEIKNEINYYIGEQLIKNKDKHLKELLEGKITNGTINVDGVYAENISYFESMMIFRSTANTKTTTINFYNIDKKIKKERKHNIMTNAYSVLITKVPGGATPVISEGETIRELFAKAFRNESIEIGFYAAGF